MSSTSSANAGHAVAAKKKCKKKGKKSAAEAKKKKKKCKKKKAPVATPPAPVQTPPPVNTSGHTLRASLSFDDITTEADLDLYVWDAEGRLAYFDGNDIPNSETTSNSDSPEQFFDRELPSTREFTYGVCVYRDGDSDEGTDLDVPYTLDAPGDSPPFTDSDTLSGTGAFALYLGPYNPDPLLTGGWCQTYLDFLP